VAAVQKIEIGSGTIFRALLILLLFWLVYALWDIILMLSGAIIVASAIEPLANYLQKFRMPRALSVILVYVVLVLVLVGLGSLMVEPLVKQARQLALAVPNIIDSLAGFTALIPQFDKQAVIDAIQGGLLNFGNDIANVGVGVFEGTRTFVGGLVSFLFIFVLAFYLVLERDALKKFARMVTPPAHAAYAERVIERAQRRVGRWLLGQLALGTAVGLIVGLGLWAFGVPYALLLAILAGLMEFIPVIGPIIAAIPGVLVALTQSVGIGVAVLVFYIIVGQIESHLLIPNIMKRAVGLRPLVTILAVLIGARTIGIVGILLAVPVAAVFSIFVSDIFRGQAGSR